MRITDEISEESETSYAPKPSANNIMSQLRTQTTVSDTPPDPNHKFDFSPIEKKVVADVQGSKLKSLLNSLKK